MDDPANKDNDLLEVRQPLNLLTLILKDWTAYLGSIAAALAGVAGVWAGLVVVTDDNSVLVWSTIAITVIPPAMVYVFVTGPKRAMARRFHRLRDSTVRARDDFFRLTLWNQGDYTNFHRAAKRQAPCEPSGSDGGRHVSTQRRGAMVSTAPEEGMTGTTSKRTRSAQRDIHSSSGARSSHCITW